MRLLCFLFITLYSLNLKGQCPPPRLDHILSSQERVDAFVEAYRNCEAINGNIDIVQGLSGTQDIDEIATPITDITGLHFLKIVSGDLRISVNLPELDGFNNLTDVAGNFVITASNSLKTISGFNNLTNARSVTIALNPILRQVGGFGKMTKISQSIEIGNSPSIENITGFQNLESVGGQLNISKNPKLISMPSFNKLTTIGEDLNLTSNPVLQEAIGFEELTYIGNDLNIELIKTIRGFGKLQIIERFLDIRGLTVEEVPEFPLLENVGASLRISNTSVKSITGFDSLERIGEKYFLDDWFSISDNLLLDNVKGFGRFAKVEGDVRVQRNPRLSDCSWLCNLINNGEITGALTIQDNIGDCFNAIKVILICDIDFDDDTIANAVDLDDDNDGILDTLEGNGIVDTDNDGYPDSLDLDSDNDNCFDVLEAGFEDPNKDGILGDLPDTVNFQGLIINESTGYTTPDDTNINTIFDFQELNILSPGKNGLVEICRNFANIDLFKSLNGSPDLGGTWSPALASGTSIFDPRKDVAGIYTYTQTDPVCGDLSADVKVEFLSDLSAGIDTAVLTCEGVVLIDLFKSLNGNPSPGGFWSPALASGTNMYDKRNDTRSEYKYVVVDEVCGTLQSTVTITNSQKPNSGVSTALQICEFSEPINLFSLLEGNPDTNGVWSPTLLNGVFDPEVDLSNTYSYTVDNGPCGIATSTVVVEVIKNEALTNVGVIINDFSSVNNNIEVRAYSSREYEYSMDGINYQKENIFNNVAGGDQTVFVRGKDGCEFFSKDIFVRSYPVFFTPNNDGKNDFWRLKDFPNVSYTIFIYSRFGQIIKEIKSTTGFWDGNLNGKPMSSSDYWFKVVVTDTGEVLQGNFSLLRK